MNDMFICLQLNLNETEHFGFFRDLFRNPKIEIQKIDVPNGLPFFILKAKKYRGKIPIETIIKKAGKLKNRIVSESGANELPDLVSFEPRALQQHLLFNSALCFLEESFSRPISKLALIDFDGEMKNKLSKLVPLCENLSVVTNSIDSYEIIEESIMENFGLSIYLTDKIDRYILESEVIISDKSDLLPECYHGILFTNERRKNSCKKTYMGSGISGENHYLNLCPKGIDEVAFLSALYEFSNVKSLNELQYNSFHC